MLSKDENVRDAADAINALIDSDFGKAMSASSMDEAFYDFGLASHTFQDKMAPPHYDASGPMIWYKDDFTSINNIWNHSGELFVSPSQENKSDYAFQLKTKLQR